MPQINNTRIGYYAPSNKVLMFRFETEGERKEIVERRDITNEFLNALRDFVSHAAPVQYRIPNLIGRFRNWIYVRVLARPDSAPMAVTRYFMDECGNKHIISITTIPAKELK